MNGDWQRVWLGLAALALLIVTLMPIFYIGGGADDYHYVAAAKCWAEQGPCLPANHWETRWPLIAPMSAGMALFGASRVTAALAPFAFSLAALAAFAWVAARLFGWRAALIGGFVLVLTPIVSQRLAHPNADMAELAFLLAGVAAWLKALDGRNRQWAVAAGVALALAVQTRETSLVCLALFGGWFLILPGREKRVVLWALPGFAAPLLAEMIVHWVAAGDPLLRYRLALGHTKIFSAELAPWVDTSRSPLLNPDYIAGWTPANGIEAHWTVKPIVNLLTHPMIGFTLICTAMLLVMAGKAAPGAVRRKAVLAIALPAAASLVLIYVLAVDPKPRSFLPLLAGAALGFGALACHGWRERRLPVAAAATVVLMLAFKAVVHTPSLARADDVAAAWIAQVPGPLAMDENTQRLLLFVPAARAASTSPASNAPHRLSLVKGGCDTHRKPGETIMRAEQIVAQSPPGSGHALCLFHGQARSAAVG